MAIESVIYLFAKSMVCFGCYSTTSQFIRYIMFTVEVVLSKPEVLSFKIPIFRMI